MFKDENALRDFINSVNTSYRFAFDCNKNEFIEEFSNQIKENEAVLKTNSVLFRSQIGYIENDGENSDGEYYCERQPYKIDRMIPKKEFSSHGRINPKGIPYLYLSSDAKTSIAETKPLLGNTITVCEFIIKQELKLVVFDKEYKNLLSFRDISGASVDECIWNELNYEFSKPITHDDKELEYLPTQILSEIIKLRGYDGIGFKSSLSNGYNVALFDLNVAQPINAVLYDVKKIDYEVSQSSQKYKFRNQ